MKKQNSSIINIINMDIIQISVILHNKLDLFGYENVEHLICKHHINSSFENFKKNNQKLLKWTIQRTPMNRWGNSLEIANIASFLISDDSSYINGETINIDGGWSNT